MKLTTLAETLQGIRSQIMPYRNRRGYQECEREREGSFEASRNECWTCGGMEHLLG